MPLNFYIQLLIEFPRKIPIFYRQVVFILHNSQIRQCCGLKHSRDTCSAFFNVREKYVMIEREVIQTRDRETDRECQSALDEQHQRYEVAGVLLQDQAREQPSQETDHSWMVDSSMQGRLLVASADSWTFFFL